MDAALQSGVREVYPDNASSIIPYMRMAYSNTGGDISSAGYTLGIFLVKAHYTVRGRRAIPIPVSTRIRMLGLKEFEELRAAMELVEQQKRDANKQIFAQKTPGHKL